MKRLCALFSLLALTSCFGPRPNPHYELGRPYQMRGVWFYPGENFNLDQTGLAAVFGSSHPRLTSDGEAFSQSVVMAGHPSIQLPAIARLTNLENGRSILVRINDRGAGNPARLLDVTRRTAALLGMRDDGATRVRVQVLAEESHAASDALPGHPRLAVATAPRGAVVATDLPPPPGMGAAPIKAAPLAATPTPSAEAPVPLTRLPETVTLGPANPGRLWVRLDAFEEAQYAAVQQARMRDLGATTERTFDGKVHRFGVLIGPIDTVRQADDVLRQALARGIPDAHIVVEPTPTSSSSHRGE